MCFVDIGTGPPIQTPVEIGEFGKITGVTWPPPSLPNLTTTQPPSTTTWPNISFGPPEVGSSFGGGIGGQTQPPPSTGIKPPPGSGTAMPPDGSGTGRPPGSSTGRPPGSGTRPPEGSDGSSTGVITEPASPPAGVNA